MRKIYFGNFRLEIQAHPHEPSQTLLRLFCNDQPQPTEHLQLRLLKLFADDYPNVELTVNQIAAAIWPTAPGGGPVQKQISLLRTKVLYDDAQKPQFIQTFRDSNAYKFIASVRSEGDIERLSGLPKWSPARLTECLGKLSSGNGDSEELRIVTSGLVPNYQDFPYEQYLGSGIRIRIIMLDPDDETLMRARYDLRRDNYTYEDARRDLKQQIGYLSGLISSFSNEALQVRLSRAMPCGLVLHSADWALLGIFPAQGSYSLGPMIEVTKSSSLWRTLYTDWKVRWDDPNARSITHLRKD